MPIEVEDDVILVRRAARELAQKHGFDVFASAALTTATSELTRNVWVHARRGVAILEELLRGDQIGVRITFVDAGPGIPDIPRVMAGGYSTAKSMGLGLSGSRRLVDEFDLSSTVGNGTTVAIVKWRAP
jgi:serine/threonine-protein kinase RsbT